MRILISLLVTMGMAFGASAAPITEFETNYDGSNVEVTDINDDWSIGNLDLSLSNTLKSTKFSLEEGESKSFDFLIFAFHSAKAGPISMQLLTF